MHFFVIFAYQNLPVTNVIPCHIKSWQKLASITIVTKCVTFVLDTCYICDHFFATKSRHEISPPKRRNIVFRLFVFSTFRPRHFDFSPPPLRLFAPAVAPATSTFRPRTSTPRDYSCERGSALHACFLDARSAFDNVWIIGLLYKLYHIGVRGKLLRIINDSFQNVTSKVFLNGNASEPFEILQGTRQGSICAPFYYTVFVNGLLYELQNSNYGLKIADLELCAPTQADDIVLLALSRRSLQALLTICSTYANRWRYTYNAGKCATMVMDRKRSRRIEPKKLSYGTTTINEETRYKHLGVIQSPSGRYPFSADAAKQCIRGTFLSLSNKVSGRDGANPLTLLKLYRTSVLPRALFGCELWSAISKTDMQQLEIAQHFCLKFAQGLPALTRSDMATGLLGITRIEAYIDHQKLRFLGSLCRTPSDDIVSKLFTHRLFQYKSCNVQCKYGFVPDIFSILNKYGLIDYIENFISCGEFPSKYAWKQICKKQVLTLEQSQWLTRMDTSQDFAMFKQIHQTLVPASIWIVAKQRPNCLKLMRFMAKLCCKIYEHKHFECLNCDTYTTREFDHRVVTCSSNDSINTSSLNLLTIIG